MAPGLMTPAKEAEKPASLPWLAVVLMPPLLNLARDNVAWLGDFERRLAWTILKEQSNH